MNRRPRLLILIVAYNAETTLGAVLDRIPNSVLLDLDCEVLVIDDASTDNTFDVGRAYRAGRPMLPLVVLRNATNQGYGGNQKIGYHYASKEGFDFVALVHGDGQYAPEELPRLLEPLLCGEADAVFGSRMMVKGAARRGGMPLYKFVGNKVLSATQNFLAGVELSEWHSGYRLYRVSTLENVRLASNANDFSFDSQIILQLIASDARIRELSIPTFYGDEICRVNGMKYAGQVFREGVRHLFHRWGLLQQHWLRPVRPSAPHYAVKIGYDSSHTQALSRIPAGTSVMDLGSGDGAFASMLAGRGLNVTAVDIAPPVVLDPQVATIRADLNQPLDLPLDDVDCITLLDVLGHLDSPESFAEELRHGLGATPRLVIVTTANVAFVVTRLMLLMGQFNYSDYGVLDRQHNRLFTFRTLRSLLEHAGYDVLEVKGIPAPFPRALRTRWLANLLLTVNRALIGVAPRLFSFQVMVVARSRPHLDELLAIARSSADVAA
ncbi:glycosyltransferase [Knoellia koreensis]|uniref:Glycosyltransferase n=1 Tax=Knoellia koreensis TaxID=2730921 RepID=A0A849HFZ8_9MICO|nr:glycosyltransferase [Knoellia sp. DB2414S]